MHKSVKPCKTKAINICETPLEKSEGRNVPFVDTSCEVLLPRCRLSLHLGFLLYHSISERGNKKK